MTQDFPFIEIGLAAMAGAQPITEESLTDRSISALRKHPENVLEVVLTSLVLFGEQEADSKLLLHLERLAEYLEERKQPGKEMVYAKKTAQKTTLQGLRTRQIPSCGRAARNAFCVV